MNNPNSPADPPASRSTLKLKVAARKPKEEVKAAVVPRPQPKPAVNPGARWSDEYKQRMQADMDELALNRR